MNKINRIEERPLNDGELNVTYYFGLLFTISTESAAVGETPRDEGVAGQL